jgi:hypothetical protein
MMRREGEKGMGEAAASRWILIFQISRAEGSILKHKYQSPGRRPVC